VENPLTIGRLELLWRTGSWRRTDEWVWGRQACDTGCFIFDVLFFTVTWLRGAHVTGKSHCYKGVCDFPEYACVCPCRGCDYAKNLSQASPVKP
jgi:hypothetical protein